MVELYELLKAWAIVHPVEAWVLLFLTTYWCFFIFTTAEQAWPLTDASWRGNMADKIGRVINMVYPGHYRGGWDA